MRADGVSSLTFRMAESLTVRGVYSPEFGRLLHLRVVGQNSLIVNLPAQLVRDTELWLDVVYRGRLPPQGLDREAIDLGQQDLQETQIIPIEPRFLYSNRSYWYPQATVTDYATAKVRITVPNDFDVVASGDSAGPPAPPPGVVDPGRRRKTYVFDAAQTDPVPGGRDQPVQPGRYAADFGGRERRRARRPEQPATGLPRPRHGREGRGRLQVLRVAGRGRTVSELHAGDRRKRSSRRTQPAVFRDAEPGRHRHDVRVAQRSRQLRELPDVLPGARGRAPVVGARGGLEELPRAVDQRRLRAVLRRALRREGPRGQRAREPAAADAPHRHRAPRTRVRFTSATAWDTSGRTIACSVRSSTTRPRWCCTCSAGWSATTRSSQACGASTSSASSGRREPTISAAPSSRRAAAIWNGSSRRGSTARRSPA